MSENDNPSKETREEIKKGINWLANWYKERCEAGFISSSQYNEIIKKLKSVKIYTTKQGCNRVTEDLEKGTLNFSPEMLEKGATLDMWKRYMAKKNVFPSGWCPKSTIAEPIILIDVDNLKNDPTKSIASTVVHELTHLTVDTFDGEADLKKILQSTGADAQKIPPIVNGKVDIDTAITAADRMREKQTHLEKLNAKKTI